MVKNGRREIRFPFPKGFQMYNDIPKVSLLFKLYIITSTEKK